MILEIQPNIFCAKIPLPGSPLKNMNSYILKTDDRNLIIDTGFNHEKSLEAMQRAQQALNLDLDRTDLFITHFHIDHFGLVPQLVSRNTQIYFNRIETELQEDWEGFDGELDYLARHGFPKHLVAGVLEDHPAKDYFPVRWPKEAHLIDDGDRITLGPFQLEFVHTPGHSPGHMCLYESNHKILFCGDHLLSEISPIIMCWSEKENRLKAYLESLLKTRNLDVSAAYPGHHDFIYNHQMTTDRLLTHHEIRLSEILNILANKPQTAFAIAAKMGWNFKDGNWDDFPDVQKCFATSEAVAHLRYLEKEGKIRSLFENGRIYFRQN